MTKQQTIGVGVAVGGIVVAATGAVILRTPSAPTTASVSASMSKRLSAPPALPETPDDSIAKACARLVELRCEEGTHLDCHRWLPRVIADHSFSVSQSDKSHLPLLTAECVAAAPDVAAVRACGKAIICKLPEMNP